MTDEHDVLVELLAKMLEAGISYRTDTAVYAGRIAERLGLGEDDSEEVIAAELRKALRPVARPAAGGHPVELAAGVDVYGTVWGVSAGGRALFIDAGDRTAVIAYEGEPERFAEAVARAVTPGQEVSGE